MPPPSPPPLPPPHSPPPPGWLHSAGVRGGGARRTIRNLFAPSLATCASQHRGIWVVREIHIHCEPALVHPNPCGADASNTEVGGGVSQRSVGAVDGAVRVASLAASVWRGGVSISVFAVAESRPSRRSVYNATTGARATGGRAQIRDRAALRIVWAARARTAAPGGDGPGRADRVCSAAPAARRTAAQAYGSRSGRCARARREPGLGEDATSRRTSNTIILLHIIGFSIHKDGARRDGARTHRRNGPRRAARNALTRTPKRQGDIAG